MKFKITPLYPPVGLERTFAVEAVDETEARRLAHLAIPGLTNGAPNVIFKVEVEDWVEA